MTQIGQFLKQPIEEHNQNTKTNKPGMLRKVRGRQATAEEAHKQPANN